MSGAESASRRSNRGARFAQTWQKAAMIIANPFAGRRHTPTSPPQPPSTSAVRPITSSQPSTPSSMDHTHTFEVQPRLSHAHLPFPGRDQHQRAADPAAGRKGSCTGGRTGARALGDPPRPSIRPSQIPSDPQHTDQRRRRMSVTFAHMDGGDSLHSHTSSTTPTDSGPSAVEERGIGANIAAAGRQKWHTCRSTSDASGQKAMQEDFRESRSGAGQQHRWGRQQQISDETGPQRSHAVGVTRTSDASSSAPISLRRQTSKGSSSTTGVYQGVAEAEGGGGISTVEEASRPTTLTTSQSTTQRGLKLNRSAPRVTPRARQASAEVGVEESSGGQAGRCVVEQEVSFEVMQGTLSRNDEEEKELGRYLHQHRPSSPLSSAPTPLPDQHPPASLFDGDGGGGVAKSGSSGNAIVRGTASDGRFGASLQASVQAAEISARQDIRASRGDASVEEQVTESQEDQFWLTPSRQEQTQQEIFALREISLGSGHYQQQHQQQLVGPMSEHTHEVGVAYTTNEESYAIPQYSQHYEPPPPPPPQQQISQPVHQHVASGVNGVQEAHPAPTPVERAQNEIVAASNGGNRVFGLSRDLAGLSPDSAYLPSPQNAFQPMGAVHPHLSPGANQSASSSKLSTPGLDNAQALPSSSGSNSSSHAHLPAAQPQHAPASQPSVPPPPPPGNASHFSIEVIAPSFDKRGYPIFSGRAARIRGIIRMKAMRGCQVEIKLGAYISQGAPAAVWDGIALMPPESGNDRKVFAIREVIELDESMVRSPDRRGSDPQEVFETTFDINLPLGMSTRFVNGEPTVTAVALPPSYEMSSEVARERDPSRSSGGGLMKSSAASVLSRSSRLTSLTTSGAQIGVTVRDAVERGFGEVYRIGCFYTMEFTLQRSAEAAGISQPRRFFGKNKASKFAALDKIIVPFIFLGEQSQESPPPLSIPAVLIANAVARPGSFLGDGWQCERATVKWPGRTSKHLKRNVTLELHMPDPATIHAPSLFPVLIILRPEDHRLLDAVPAEAVIGSPNADDDQTWAAKGRSHSRQTSVSTQRQTKVPDSPNPENGGSGHEQETLDSHDTGQDGMLSKFMRSSLSLSRKGSYGNGLQSQPPNASDAQSMKAGVSGGSRNDGAGPPPGTASSGSSYGGGQSSRRSGHTTLRDAVANKLRKRPSTAPPSQASSEARSRISGSTMMGADGQYVGALSGLVRVTLVQTTFCVGSGPSDLPKNLRKLISIAEVEELDTEAVRSMARPRRLQEGGAEDEEESELQQALQDQIDGKGVRVLRALFRVGSDPTPSFRCHGIELRYGIKVDLVPFRVRQKNIRRPTSTGAASGSSGGTEAVSGTGLPKSFTSSTVNVQTGSTTGISHPPSSSAGFSEASGVTPSLRSSTVRDLGSKRSMDFSLFRGSNGTASEYGGEHVPRSGDTVVSTVYADRAHSYNKIEKGVGVLFASVRLVRAAV